MSQPRDAARMVCDNLSEAMFILRVELSQLETMKGICVDEKWTTTALMMSCKIARA